MPRAANLLRPSHRRKKVVDRPQDRHTPDTTHWRVRRGSQGRRIPWNRTFAWTRGTLATRFVASMSAKKYVAGRAIRCIKTRTREICARQGQTHCGWRNLRRKYDGPPCPRQRRTRTKKRANSPAFAANSPVLSHGCDSNASDSQPGWSTPGWPPSMCSLLPEPPHPELRHRTPVPPRCWRTPYRWH